MLKYLLTLSWYLFSKNAISSSSVVCLLTKGPAPFLGPSSERFSIPWYIRKKGWSPAPNQETKCVLMHSKQFKVVIFAKNRVFGSQDIFPFFITICTFCLMLGFLPSNLVEVHVMSLLRWQAFETLDGQLKLLRLLFKTMASKYCQILHFSVTIFFITTMALLFFPMLVRFKTRDLWINLEQVSYGLNNDTFISTNFWFSNSVSDLANSLQ